MAKIVRWILGMMRKDKSRNERIERRVKVNQVGNMQERRLQCFGHCMRRKGYCIGRRIIKLRVEGARERETTKSVTLDKEVCKRFIRHRDPI